MTVSNEFCCQQESQQVHIHTAESHRLVVDIYGPNHVDTVILIHGLGADATVWNEFGFTSLLVEHGFRVISFDLRGHGRSVGLPTGQNSAIHSCMSDLRRIIEHLEIKSCHLVGHSLGGVLALLAPALCPATDYVGLTVLSAHCYRQDLQKYRDWLSNDLSSWVSWVAEELGVEESHATRLLGRHQIDALKDYVAEDQSDFSGLVGLSLMPTFLIAGAQDQGIEKIQRLSQQFKHPINVLKGVGHVGILGQLDAFKSDLLWHLQGTFGLFSDRHPEV
jgi:pimeloyl-ACP methyl ester carboxylesterase